jgi:hypothetical protein
MVASAQTGNPGECDESLASAVRRISKESLRNLGDARFGGPLIIGELQPQDIKAGSYQQDFVA